MTKKIIIAIDGPAGSGKTSCAKIVAEKLNYIYIDTGAMYRAVTLAWLMSNTELTPKNLRAIVDNINIQLEPSIDGQVTKLNNKDVSQEIRSLDVTKYVSPVSADPYVREKMVSLQRKLAINRGCVMDGRDIGTDVFPDAELKLYLVADLRTRAKRRLAEIQAKEKTNLTIEDISRQIIERDKYDSSRAVSPLRKAEDAIEIDTSSMTLIEQSEKIYQMALDTINKII